MTESDLEYDRFGPWIIEISEIDPPPPLFRPYLTRKETPLISVKVPRKIERRVAHPGMNLYDYMVTLYQEDLVILERDGDEVKQVTFFYGDIQDLRLGLHLLRGGLRLRMAGNAYEIPFNTVSADLVGRLVELIRERYTGEFWVPEIDEDPDIPPGDLSYYFTRLLARETADFQPVRLLAAQTHRSVGSYEMSAFRKLFFGIISKELLESLHFSTGRELKIITHGPAFRYTWQSVHGRDIYFIPLDKIKGVKWERDPQNAVVVNLILETRGGLATFAFTSDNPWIPFYDRFLTAVLGLREGAAGI